MKHCDKCGLGEREWMACDSPDCGELKEQVATAVYGIIDPDYARIFTKARCIAWGYGYTVVFNGSFTRDLDLLFVPWADSARNTNPTHLIRLLCDRCDLQENGHPPTEKPHGRIAHTLMFKEPKDPRFIDISFMPQGATK